MLARRLRRRPNIGSMYRVWYVPIMCNVTCASCGGVVLSCIVKWSMMVSVDSYTPVWYEVCIHPWAVIALIHQLLMISVDCTSGLWHSLCQWRMLNPGGYRPGDRAIFYLPRPLTLIHSSCLINMTILRTGTFLFLNIFDGVKDICNRNIVVISLISYKYCE